ncbi:MAG: phospholipid carrier-dependent glycosyltransferase [Micrococcales bacterium]|nr:MAG: phospholipid carrier-dependent glycosyltransferase [Micrococcales bacterium]PIE27164.1 MAG: phospholipid carrier-dependent glycosyltransferase [Micrococcales bacterium]
MPADDVQRLRAHLAGPRLTDTYWGWAGPLFVAAVAGLLRFFRLGTPHKLVFDETYYVKQAYTLLATGFENRWPEEADASFTAGTPSIFLDAGDRAVHPPVGKWMLAVGIRLFGVDSSFGWRFAAAACGTLMVLMLARTARRMFGSTLLGCAAGLLLAVDGNHLVMSRTAILDIFLAFFALAAFSALVADRFWARERLAELVVARSGVGDRRDLGPWLVWRPWRLVAAVSLGLACGVKWSGLYFFAAFGLMTVLWDMGALRAAGVRRWASAGLLRDGITAFVTMAPVILVVYVSTWSGWIRSSGGYLRHWGSQHPSGVPVPDWLRSLWHYHADMYKFHLTLNQEHTYMSNPWAWLIQSRPTSFFYEAPADVCGTEQCSQAITSLGNPVVWWGGTLALLFVVAYWVGARDWRAGAILAGMAGGYLPWFAFQERTIYTFYAVAFVPYTVLALTYGLGLVLGVDRVSVVAGRRQRPTTLRVVAAAAVVLAAVVAAWFFWPVWVAEVIPHAAWQQRMWLPSWI